MATKSRSASGLVGWLTDTRHPLFVIDRRRRVRFFNAGCVALTGCQPGDVIGKPCEYVTEPLAPLSQRIRQAIAPPEEVYQGQQLLAPLQFIDAHGESRKTQVLFLPLPGGMGEIDTVLGIVLTLAQPPKQLLPSAAQALHSELGQILHRQAQQYQIDSLVAASYPMQRVASQLQLARQSSTPVHLHGPRGAGKLYSAQLLFHQSGRDQLPVILHCRVLPPSEQRRLLKDLLEHGPEPSHPIGLILKDVDQLAADLQELLAERLSNQQWPSGLRLASTSLRPLSELASTEDFNARLAFLLTPLSIEIPGLEARQADLEPLIQWFVEQQNHGRQQQITSVDRTVLDSLLSYRWTENARELKQLVTEAVSACEGATLTAEHLPFRWKTGKSAQQTVPAPSAPFAPLQETLESAERIEILRALDAAQQNKAKAAELLGLTRARLYRRLDALGLNDTTNETTNNSTDGSGPGSES